MEIISSLNVWICLLLLNFKSFEDTQWSFSESLFGDPYGKNGKEVVGKYELIGNFNYKHRSLLSSEVRNYLDKFVYWLQSAETEDKKKKKYMD